MLNGQNALLSVGMKYGVNDKPKPLEMLGYALQWFCVMIPTVLVLAGVVSKLHYDDAGMQTVYTQKMFFLTGLALVVQVFWGHKMPVMIGPASVLLVGILSSRNASIDAIYTAIALGGLMLIPLSFGRVFNVIQKVITPRIIIVILMLVALSLAPLVLKLSLGIGQVSAFKSFAFSLSLAFAVMFLGAKLPARGSRCRCSSALSRARSRTGRFSECRRAALPTPTNGETCGTTFLYAPNST